MKKKSELQLIILVFGIVFTILTSSKQNFSDVQDTSECNVEIQGNLRTALWEDRIYLEVGEWDESQDYSPTCVVIGDANNDGFNDIVSTYPHSMFDSFPGYVAIHLWNPISSDWDTEITKTVGIWPRSVIIGDADGDGFNDIVTANYGGDNISILLWNPDISDWDPEIQRPTKGFFPSHITEGGDPINVAMGDINGDGYNDILVANELAADSGAGLDYFIVIYWGGVGFDNENYAFILNTNDALKYVCVENMNGDTNPTGGHEIDDIIAVYETDQVYVIYGESSWDPSDQWVINIDSPPPLDIEVLFLSTGIGPRMAFAGDANNDGLNDVIVANPMSQNISIFLKDSSDPYDFMPEITRSVGSSPMIWSWVFVGDANNDGYNDIVSAHPSEDVSIFLWNPKKSDWDPAITPFGGYTGNGQVGDANNDGQNEIVHIANNGVEEEDIGIILWSTMLPITVHSPVNKVYTDLMGGYYPATFGFENDKDGSFPSEWVEDGSGSYQGNVYVVASKEKHNKTLYLNDINTGTRLAPYQLFDEEQTSGTVELWVYFNSHSEQTQIRLFNNSGDNILRIYTEANEWKYFNGTTSVATGLNSIDEWFHVSIDFSGDGTYKGLSANTYKFSIHQANGSLYYESPEVDYYMLNTGDATRLEIFCRLNQIIECWVDAIGYSWENNYNIGDNLKEGLLLNFSCEYLLKNMEYSLDGQNKISIPGNTTIPMPDDGQHTIQIFGNDTIGTKYQSNSIEFTVKIAKTPINPGGVSKGDDDDDAEDEGAVILFVAIIVLACVGAGVGVIFVLIKKGVIELSKLKREPD